ncbi:hypothetical protein G6F65_020217 [Rhizopus arrhizus]|nr:hypothetical protein G6F65_020217 [Rhizopus arrhizus]
MASPCTPSPPAHRSAALRRRNRGAQAAGESQPAERSRHVLNSIVAPPRQELFMYQSQTVIGRTVAAKDAALADCVWPEDALHYIPDWVYTSSAVYDQEVEKIFHGKTWNYVALEAELPNPGDYKRSYVGPTPVVVSRAEDGSVNVFENRCAHRGAEFCRNSQGNAKEFVCPYHQWSTSRTTNTACASST